MNEEMAGQDTDPADGGEETVVDRPSSDTPNEGAIVNGIWFDTNMQAYTLRREIDNTQPVGRLSIVRAIFGGAVFLTDELSERSSLSGDDELTGETVEAALRQAMEQQQSTEDRPFDDLRYGAIGLVSGALDAAQNGTGRISNLTSRVARMSSKVIGPAWNSFLFTPIRRPVMRVEQAAEEKVDEWIARGRVEEVRSRVLTEVRINNFVENSVTEITENEQVQMIVQQVIGSQSTSLLGEIIGQTRERFVSLDLLLLGRLRRGQVAAPDFRDAYLRAMTERRPQYERVDLNASQAGTYAGPLARLTAFMIDLVVLLFAAGLLSSFISSTLALFDLRANVISFLQSGGLLPAITIIFIVLINFLVIAVYFVASWYLSGSTPGDLVFGIRVVNKEGQHASFWRSFLRLIGTVISAVFLFLGFIWALFDRRRQGWHDKIAGTFVLYDWPAKPSEDFLHDQVDAS